MPKRAAREEDGLLDLAPTGPGRAAETMLGGTSLVWPFEVKRPVATSRGRIFKKGRLHRIQAQGALPLASVGLRQEKGLLDESRLLSTPGTFIERLCLVRCCPRYFTCCNSSNPLNICYWPCCVKGKLRHRKWQCEDSSPGHLVPEPVSSTLL